MSDYGDAAVKAVELYRTGYSKSPREAWDHATANIFGKGNASQTKGCPRDAFLGLCNEGLVKDIPSGTYSKSIKNKKYAINALNILKQNPSLDSYPKKLWEKVMAGEQKAHNQQMNIVIALWRKGLIRIY